MIEPTTRLFGLLMSEPREAWIARLYNYLFGANGLDAAYLTFLVRPDAVARTLDGLTKGLTVERLHIAPGHWQAVTDWARTGPVDVLDLRRAGAAASSVHAELARRLRPDDDLVSAWSDAELWTTRAVREIEQAFGLHPAVPSDLASALSEATFRPCKLTHDDFVARPGGHP